MAGAAIVGLGAAALKLGTDFQNARNIIIRGTGAAGDALTGLYDTAKSVFSRIPTTLDAAAKAVADFNTLTGATGEVLEGLSIQALEAARMLGEDATALISETSRAFNVFEISAEDGLRVLDQMFVAAQDTGISMTKLATNLQVFGPVLKNLGFSITESIALFSSLHKAGIDVTRIMPGINRFMRQLATEGVTDLKGAFADVIAKIKGATTEAEALNIATTAFGAEGAQRLMVAVRTGAIDLEAFTAKLDTTGKAIFDTAAETRTLSERFQILKNKALVKLEPMLMGLITQLDRLAIWVDQEVIPAIEEWYAEHQPAIQKALDDFQALLRDEVIPIIKQIVAVVEEWMPRIQAVIERVWPRIQEIIEFRMGMIRDIITFVLAVLQGDWGRAWEALRHLAATIWDQIVSDAKSRLALLRDAIGFVLGALQTYVWDQALAVGKKIIQGIWAGIQGLKGWLLSKARGLAGDIMGILNPKNWFGSPKGLQNWLPYYFEQGIENLRRVMDRAVPLRLEPSVRSFAGGLGAQMGATAGPAGGAVIHIGQIVLPGVHDTDTFIRELGQRFDLRDRGLA